MTDSFYRAFEDKHRGSRELIKSRLQVYLPFIKPLLDKKQETKALDLGCGRGEWLELLTEQGFIAQGVDIDKGMLEACWELGLKAEKVDALDYLKSLKANSFAIISGFHIVEHIPFEMLQELVDQALRILKPGGLLILETPNPENIVVGTANFYLDPTHKQPLPPLLLSFVAEHAGYARVKILRLQEPEGLHESQNLTLIDVLSGVSPDYSIVAQKTAAKTALKKFDVAFSREYGVMLNEIANLYDGQLKIKTDDLKTKWSDEHQRAEQLAVEANQYHLEKETTKQEFLLALMEKETRLQEVTATGIENKQQIDKLHVSLIDSQEQQQALKTALKEIGQQRLQLETQLDDQLSKKEDAINWLNKELQTLYNSKSWRITWPLRKSMLFFKWLFVLPIDIILCLVHLPRRIGRNILIKVIKHVSKSSKLRSTLVLRLNRYPNIKVRLKPFIIHNGLGALVPTPAVNKENEACENDIYHESILDFKADHLNNNLGTGECLGQSRITDGVNQEKKTPLEKWFY